MIGRLPDIDQEFFWNDQLGLCSPLARLLWLGMCLIAGEQGRLEDRPMRIKAQLLPYDDVNVDTLIDQLEAQGLLSSDVGPDGQEYIELKPLHRLNNVPDLRKLLSSAIIEYLGRTTGRAWQACKQLAETAVAATCESDTPGMDLVVGDPNHVKRELTPEQQPVVDKPDPKVEISGKGKTGKGQGKSHGKGGPPSGVHEWLEPEKAAIIRGWVAEGKTFPEICDLMGRARPTVSHWKRHYPEFAALLEPQPAEPAQPTVVATFGQLDRNEHPRTRQPREIDEWLTPERAAEIRRLVVEEGIRSIKAIAETMEMPYQKFHAWNTHYPHFAKLFDPPPDPRGLDYWLQPEGAAQIRELVNQGLPPIKVAERLGIDPNKLVQWKVMSEEFAALFRRQRKSIPAQGDVQQAVGRDND